MVMLPLLVSGIMASTSMAGTIEVRKPAQHQCGTRGLSAEDRELLKRQTPQKDGGEVINLGAVFHFCPGSGGSGGPSEESGRQALQEMNQFYDQCKIKFNLEQMKKIDDQQSCNAGLENEQVMNQLKSSVRVGNSSTLNVVYVPTNSGSGVKGVCILGRAEAISQGVQGYDGCAVAQDTLPGGGGGGGGGGGQPGGQPGGGSGGGSGGPGGRGGLGRGHRHAGLSKRQGGSPDAPDITTTHEAGHWLGEDHSDSQGGGGQGGGGIGGFGGLFDRLFRRQGGGGGGTLNIMGAVSQPGASYKFDQQQCDRMRQIAMARAQAASQPVGGGGGGGGPGGPSGPGGKPPGGGPSGPGGKPPGGGPSGPGGKPPGGGPSGPGGMPPMGPGGSDGIR